MGSTCTKKAVVLDADDQAGERLPQVFLHELAPLQAHQLPLCLLMELISRLDFGQLRLEKGLPLLMHFWRQHLPINLVVAAGAMQIHHGFGARAAAIPSFAQG